MSTHTLPYPLPEVVGQLRVGHEVEPADLHGVDGSRAYVVSPASMLTMAPVM